VAIERVSANTTGKHSRSYAILRSKDIFFTRMPSLPTTRHRYESPDIHYGFLQLISSYVPLDESFVAAWNYGSDPRMSATTYLLLQERLARPPNFISKSHTSNSSHAGTGYTPQNIGLQHESSLQGPASPTTHIKPEGDAEADEPIPASTFDQPEPTAIQKADLLITQQWLRLVVWQSSCKQGILQGDSPHDSMRFAFPLSVARQTAAVLHSLSPSAVEVHGMGIFEKIFEIGTSCINVLQAYDSASSAFTRPGGRSLAAAMDFVSGADIGVFSLGRKGVSIDPLEFFVRTLSASPNSRTRFAESLLRLASERPGGLKMSLSPSLSPMVTTTGGSAVAASSPSARSSAGWSYSESPVCGSERVVGTILGEMIDEDGLEQQGGGFGMNDLFPNTTSETARPIPSFGFHYNTGDATTASDTREEETNHVSPSLHNHPAVMYVPNAAADPWARSANLVRDTELQQQDRVQDKEFAFSYGSPLAYEGGSDVSGVKKADDGQYYVHTQN
jgi:hypothetical protein